MCILRESRCCFSRCHDVVETWLEECDLPHKEKYLDQRVHKLSPKEEYHCKDCIKLNGLGRRKRANWRDARMDYDYKHGNGTFVERYGASEYVPEMGVGYPDEQYAKDIAAGVNHYADPPTAEAST